MNEINERSNVLSARSTTSQRPFYFGLAVIVGVIALLVSFRLGMMVGSRKAMFSYQWGQNYHHLFGGPRHGFFGMPGDDRSLIAPHGSFGKILRIDGNSFSLQGSDGIERSINVTPQTVIRSGERFIPLSSLPLNGWVVILGQPNQQGQIVASFIRTIPGN